MEIPRGSITDLDRFRVNVDLFVVQEKYRQYQLIYKHLSWKIQRFLGEKIKDCEIITNTNNSFQFEITKYIERLTWTIQNCEFSINFDSMEESDVTVTLILNNNYKLISYFKTKGVWQIVDKYENLLDINPILLNTIPKFIEEFLKLNLEIETGKINDLYKLSLRNYELYPIANTQEAIICLISIRWFRESILSILPKDIVVYIAKILWNDRKNFFK